jgi:Lrp/AsnC family transcriptional regulator, leucine-responsive regulatory protein
MMTYWRSVVHPPSGSWHHEAQPITKTTAFSMKLPQVSRQKRINPSKNGGLALKNETEGLDATDFRILRALADNGRSGDVTLGNRVNLSSTAAARRRKILEDQGVIAGYTARINPKSLGYSITALVLVELSTQDQAALMEFEKAALACPSMSFCSFLSGENDFMMIITVRSFEQYDTVYRTELSRLPYLSKIRTSFMIHEVSAWRVAPAMLEANQLA